MDNTVVKNPGETYSGPAFMREETIVLSAQNPVSEILKINEGETCFFMEADIVKRDCLSVSLGGFGISGKIITLHSRDVKKEIPTLGFQWLIIKSERVKNNETVRVKICFTNLPV